MDSILVPALRDTRTEMQQTNEAVKEISSELEKVGRLLRGPRTDWTLFRRWHERIGDRLAR